MKKPMLLLLLASILGCQSAPLTADRALPLSASRLSVDSNVQPIASSQQYMVNTRLSLLRDGKWVLVGEPQLVVWADGRQGSVSIAGGSMQYEVRAIVKNAATTTVQVSVDFKEAGALPVSTSQTLRVQAEKVTSTDSKKDDAIAAR